MSKLWNDKKKAEKALKDAEDSENSKKGRTSAKDEEDSNKKTKSREKSNSLSNSGLFKPKKSNKLKACLKTNPSLSTVLRLVCVFFLYFYFVLILQGVEMCEYILKAVGKNKKEVIPFFLNDKIIMEMIDLLSCKGE